MQDGDKFKGLWHVEVQNDEKYSWCAILGFLPSKTEDVPSLVRQNKVGENGYCINLFPVIPKAQNYRDCLLNCPGKCKDHFSRSSISSFIHLTGSKFQYYLLYYSRKAKYSVCAKDGSHKTMNGKKDIQMMPSHGFGRRREHGWFKRGNNVKIF